MSQAVFATLVNDTENEKAAIDVVEEGTQQYKTGTLGVHQPTLEDSVYYADLQYGKNNDPTEDGGLSPAAGLAKSPLSRPLFWGPESPEVPINNAVKHTGSEKDSSIDAGLAAHQHDRRVLRKVTVFGAFYLMTTDILGPFNTGYTFRQLGFATGAIMYVFMGLAAFYCGLLLNALYLRVDSDRSPVRNYGQLCYRILGPYAKIVSDILMIIQLVVNCGTIMLSNAQSLSQIIAGPNGNGHLCFIVQIVIFLGVNYALTPLRTLRQVGYLANAAVWLNIALIWCTVGFVYSSPPNFTAAMAAYGINPGPVITAAIAGGPLYQRVNGVMNMVFAYGGAMIFVDFYSEMKKPWDFWKAMSCAQTLIAVLYMVFGLLVYARQGQFTQSLAYYGVSKYSYQTVGNVIAIITGVIAAVLYGNIAQKLCYYIVVEQWCKGPALMTGRGFAYWMVVNTVFWVLAFIVGAAIPQVQTISGLNAAISLLQFSYTFPLLLSFAFAVQVDAMKGDGQYVPGAGKANRADTWLQWSRWRRGLFTGAVYTKFFHLTLGLAALAMAFLGMYGSGTSIKAAFAASSATSFGCGSAVA